MPRKDPLPIPAVTVKIAVAAYDAGHRWLCAWINESFARYHINLRIKAKPPDEGTTFDACRLALANALQAYRIVTPGMEPDDKLRPWVIYQVVGDDGMLRGEGISLARNPHFAQLGYTDHQYWRSEVDRLVSVKQALCSAEVETSRRWDESKFQKCFIEPIERNAQDWFESLRAARRWNGKVPVAETDRVQLFGPNESPMIDGREKARLTAAEYRVIYGLVKAGEEGLKLDDLKDIAGGCWRILRDLRDSDRDWRSVICMAGNSGRGYHIK